MNYNLAEKFSRLFFSAILIVPLLSEAGEPDDSSLIINRFMLDNFFRVAECLSIKSSSQEKASFIKARLLQLDAPDLHSPQYMSWINSYIAQENKDREAIFQAIKKHCPASGRSAGAALGQVSTSQEAYLIDVLQEVIVRSISTEAMYPTHKQRIFEYENSAIGINTPPY